MKRRTKIICTLGPASSGREKIRELIVAGMDIARLNFSHGTHAEHKERINDIRAEAARIGRTITILQDLQGPKIRVGQMRDGGVLIHKGQKLILTSDEVEIGDEKRVHVSYKTLAEEVSIGSHILLDDGNLELKITSVDGRDVTTEVVVGGPLRSRKGVNLPNLQSNSPSLTEKDIEDLEFGLSMDVDIIALSFVRNKQDVIDLISRVRESGKLVKVIAKIEKPEAVEEIDSILDRADGIMVARGDLGIEMPLAKVPNIQKMIIRKCLERAKPVITATQMLESMIENPRPTRAEVTDVANAVLDGSDAVMLSAETAAGKYPIQTVEVMAEVICEAEKHNILDRLSTTQHVPVLDLASRKVTEAISHTAVELAERVGAVALVCLTHTGGTAQAIARHRPRIPVYGFTDEKRVVAHLGLVWGTEGFAIPFQADTDAGIRQVHQVLLENDLVKSGDRIVITAGMPLPTMGRTNMVHVSRIEE